MTPYDRANARILSALVLVWIMCLCFWAGAALWITDWIITRLGTH